jgi:hypothetical protein
LKGIQKFKQHPEEYKAIIYHTNFSTFPEDRQTYKLVKRTSAQVDIQAFRGGGFTYCEARYCPLDKDVHVQPDAYTDGVLSRHKRNRLGEPRLPGRGQGCADSPNLSLITDCDPYDVRQGRIADCWLLSAISAMAEFEGAILTLFRKTHGLESLPANNFNKYTVTLWDLPTWEAVDVVVDERLCTEPGGQKLLGAEPSASGETWVCYLEKAVAALSGGWDELDLGSVTHAWRLLTGCRDQYMIQKKAEEAHSHVRVLGRMSPGPAEELRTRWRRWWLDAS